MSEEKNYDDMDRFILKKMGYNTDMFEYDPDHLVWEHKETESQICSPSRTEEGCFMFMGWLALQGYSVNLRIDRRGTVITIDGKEDDNQYHTTAGESETVADPSLVAVFYCRRMKELGG